MSTAEISKKVQELRELRMMAEELQTEIDTLTDAIKAEMTARNTDEINGTDYKITWREIISTKLDAKRLKADHPEVCKAYTTTTKTRRFVLA